MEIKRRKILKATTLSIWINPVIGVVALPAHAQTSVATLIYSRAFGNISVSVENQTANLRVRYFFNGGSPITGSEIEYRTELNINGQPSNLIKFDDGCGAVSPSILGSASIQNYTFGDDEIQIVINSSVVGSTTETVPLGGNVDLGPFVCS